MALENLLEQDIKQIMRLRESHPAVARQFPDGVADPSPKFCQIMEEFVSWYFEARALKHTESGMIELATL